MSNRDVLVSALNDLATAIGDAPGAVIGSQSVAIGQAGNTGTVIGSRSVAIGGPGNTGTVIGSQSIATSSGTPVNAQRAQALRDGASRVAAGTASRTEIAALLAQSFLPGGSPALNEARNRADQALQASGLP